LIAFDYQSSQEKPSHLLILVNGFERTRQDFRAFRKKLSTLSPHIATIALDNRYCGETKIQNTSEPCTIQTMAQDVQALAHAYMHELNLKTYSVLGISMGGMISQTLASLESPHRIENLFLVSTTAGGSGRTWPSSIIDPKLLKYENKNKDLESTKKNMAKYFAHKFLNSSHLLFEMMCKNIVSQNSNKENTARSNIQFDISVHFDGVTKLRNISAQKTIIISGNEDHIIPLENALYLYKNIENSFYIIYENVGHLILIEEPNKFVQDVASFFA
jgi:pimeloyl-ACP methyl ester carboxylesterase